MTESQIILNAVFCPFIPFLPLKMGLKPLHFQKFQCLGSLCHAKKPPKHKKLLLITVYPHFPHFLVGGLPHGFRFKMSCMRDIADLTTPFKRAHKKPSFMFYKNFCSGTLRPQKLTLLLFFFIFALGLPHGFRSKMSCMTDFLDLTTPFKQTRKKASFMFYKIFCKGTLRHRKMRLLSENIESLLIF